MSVYNEAKRNPAAPENAARKAFMVPSSTKSEKHLQTGLPPTHKTARTKSFMYPFDDNFTFGPQAQPRDVAQRKDSLDLSSPGSRAS